MRVKISVTLSDELLPQIDALTGLFGNRSALIEKAIRDLLAVEAKRRRDIRDIETVSFTGQPPITYPLSAAGLLFPVSEHRL